MPLYYRHTGFNFHDRSRQGQLSALEKNGSDLKRKCKRDVSTISRLPGDILPRIPCVCWRAFVYVSVCVLIIYDYYFPVIIISDCWAYL